MDSINIGIGTNLESNFGGSLWSLKNTAIILSLYQPNGHHIDLGVIGQNQSINVKLARSNIPFSNLLDCLSNDCYTAFF